MYKGMSRGYRENFMYMTLDIGQYLLYFFYMNLFLFLHIYLFILLLFFTCVWYRELGFCVLGRGVGLYIRNGGGNYSLITYIIWGRDESVTVNKRGIREGTKWDKNHLKQS